MQAVNGVSLEVGHGEILGLVGESGSGKTTLARAIAGLQPTVGGEVRVEGHVVSGLRGGELRRMRRRVQVIFQDPHASLSPRLRVGFLVCEPYTIHRVAKRERKPAEELLDTVGLAPEIAEKYPHELSGGQARRVGIARALALEPTVLVADEPTAGLDVSTAAGVLNLLSYPQRRPRVDDASDHPRPERGRCCCRPDWGYVPGGGGRALDCGCTVRDATPPVHP